MTRVENNSQRLSILSRFNFPNASKRPRNISEYGIELEDPYKTFSPGDRIKGQVTLNIERPVRITHLTICLHGVVKVFKNGRTPSESNSRWRSYLATGQGKWGEAYFGNGLAALFKDEVVLAGDGCLTASSYRFKFDLELPSHGLPSSIDFQYGCISYMLSSTLTRPTTLSPTSRCEHVLAVKENINIASLPPPITQAIPLETIERKPRRVKTAIVDHKSGSPASDTLQPNQGPPVPSSAVSEASDESPKSPSISDVSCASTTSSGTIGYHSGFHAVRNGGANVDGLSIASSEEAKRKPCAKIEMLQRGCLPGDIVSVKVTINLARQFKNLQGIVLTLYRECHIDIHPAIPLGPWQNGKKQEYEDYYPRSRTGLGGLSLSSAGSSRVFRQDISQKPTALYVDKHTLTASIKASVPVPEDAFPTISSVPGAMIDFKYYVETIIDLREKSAIQERILPRLSMVNSVPSYRPGLPRLDTQENYENPKPSLNPGSSYFETNQLRREKGVITHISEIVIGTQDSSRTRAKRLNPRESPSEPRMESHGGLNSPTDDDVYGNTRENRGHGHNDLGYANDHFVDDRFNDSNTIDFAPADDVPAPEIEDQVDEKTRLRRAEELLLPSAPPEHRESHLPGDVRQPTAPHAVDELGLLISPDEPGPSAPAYDRAVTASQEIRATDSEPRRDSNNEDKQELERRRLQAQVSSPDAAFAAEDGHSEPEDHATAPAVEDTEDSAPWPQPTRRQQHVEHLPRYQA
ncbi:MAG: hypothetical protein Q9222_004957 [Ikaeria aurantiellina]